MLRVPLALSLALLVAAVIVSAEPIREEQEDSYVRKNSVTQKDEEDYLWFVEPEQEEAISNRVKRSPVVPSFDVVQKALLKKAKKKTKKLIKLGIKKSPFIALKAVKKSPFILKKVLKTKVPPLAFAGALPAAAIGAFPASLAGAAAGPLIAMVTGLAGAGAAG